VRESATLSCRVVSHNFSPEGRVDGLLVEIDGLPAQVVFPSDPGDELTRSLTPGQTADLIVETQPTPETVATAHPVYRYLSLATTESTNGRSAQPPDTLLGSVARMNYSRHGEANGVVLEQGDFIHLKPRGMRQIVLKVGDAVNAKGKARPMDAGGQVLEAACVNGIDLINDS
jgi:hypothetical protein